jgi:hypothetical protein
MRLSTWGWGTRAGIGSAIAGARGARCVWGTGRDTRIAHTTRTVRMASPTITRAKRKACARRDGRGGVDGAAADTGEGEGAAEGAGATAVDDGVAVPEVAGAPGPAVGAAEGAAEGAGATAVDDGFAVP